MTSLRILIVDDDLSIGALLAEILEGMGHVVCGIETTEAGAVTAALHSAPDRRPDLLIVDANLRYGSGIGAVAAIGRVCAIPYILMSGQRIAGAPHAATTLQKPFMHRDLESAIARAVQASTAPAA